MFVLKLYETKEQEEITLLCVYATKREAIKYAQFWCGNTGRFEISQSDIVNVMGKNLSTV